MFYVFEDFRLSCSMVELLDEEVMLIKGGQFCNWGMISAMFS